MDAREIELLVNELETRVDRLRSLYEQYFMGIERMAPSVAHKDVERRIQVLRKEQIRNTAVRFRFQMILQRYNTYQTHWQRICRQIEEGTYKRDMLRAQKRFKAPDAPAAQTSEPPPSIDVSFSSAPPPPDAEPVPPLVVIAPPIAEPLGDLDLNDFADLDRALAMPEAPTAKIAVPVLPALPRPKPVVPGVPRPVWRKVEPKAPGASAQPPAQTQPAQPQAPAPPPAPPAAAVARPPPPLPKREPPAVSVKPAPQAQPVAAPAPARSPADLSDGRLRELYSQYVQTRRSRNESTAAITYDAMARSLRESSERLREKHGKSVDFEVTVKDGKTILKPVVKKSPST